MSFVTVADHSNETRGCQDAQKLTNVVVLAKTLAECQCQGSLPGSDRTAYADELDGSEVLRVLSYPPIPTVKPRSSKFLEA